MQTYDRGSSLFWLFFSVFIIIESLRLGIGTLRNPGMGFLAFGASGLLGVFSLILFVQACNKREAAVQSVSGNILWRRVILVLAALLLYTQIMPVGGYLISTFLLMTFLFWIIERRRMGWVVAFSVMTTLATYLVFSKWLQCQFPAGLLAF